MTLRDVLRKTEKDWQKRNRHNHRKKWMLSQKARQPKSQIGLPRFRVQSTILLRKLKVARARQTTCRCRSVVTNVFDPLEVVVMDDYRLSLLCGTEAMI
jgi:hypothetical protein